MEIRQVDVITDLSIGKLILLGKISTMPLAIFRLSFRAANRRIFLIFRAGTGSEKNSQR